MSLTTSFGVMAPSSIKPEQLLARRNADWLHDFEVGRLDPVTGRVTPRPVWLIASLSRTSPRTVRRGIAEAKELRRRIDERCSGDQ